MTRVLLSACVLMLPPWGFAAAQDEPPVRNRPANFSGAVGSFQAALRVTPNEVAVGQPVTLTLRVTATGPVKAPPTRPDLAALPPFRDAFHIETVSDLAGSRPDARTWEFVYRLKPRSTRVKAVPGLPFVYYKPGVGRFSRGSYQTALAAGKPLTVRPAVPVKLPEPPKEAVAIQAPDSLFQIVAGPGVLRRPASRSLALPAAAAVLVLTPLGCLGWYLVWRRLYPDRARVTHRRRSQAARQALHALHALPRVPVPEQAQQATTILTAYLRQRTDLAAEEPTAAEVAAHLDRLGYPNAQAELAADFYRRCEAARFAPPQPAGSAGWQDEAAGLINCLEEADS